MVECDARLTSRSGPSRPAYPGLAPGPESRRSGSADSAGPPAPAAKPKKPKTPGTGQAAGRRSRQGRCADPRLVGALVAVGVFVVLYQAIDIPDPNEDFEAQTTFVYYPTARPSSAPSTPTRTASRSRSTRCPQTIRTRWSPRRTRPSGPTRASTPRASSAPRSPTPAGNATPGCVHDHPAVRQDPLPDQERSYKRKVKEAIVSLKIQQQLSKERDPRGLPQHHLLRPRRLRHPGRRAGVLRQAGQGPHPARVRRSSPACSTTPRSYDPANGKEAKRGAQGALRATSSTAWPRWAPSRGRGREGRRSGCRSSPRSTAAEPVRRPAGPHARAGRRTSCSRLGFTEEEIDGGGLRVTTTFTQKAMAAAEEGVLEQRPEGFDGGAAARRRGHRRGRHRRAARLLRRPGLPRVPDQLGGRRRHGRLDDQAARADAAAITRRLLAQGHLRGQLALRVCPTAPRFATRTRATATTTARPSRMIDGDRELDQHRVRRHDRLAWTTARRRSSDARQRPGHPRRTTGPASTRHPRHARRDLEANAAITLGKRPGQPDQHGQRLRHDRQRRQRADVHVIEKVVDRNGETATRFKARDPATRRRGHRRRRVLRAAAGRRAGHRAARPRSSAGRPPARPAPRPTTRTRCPRRGSSATRRRWRRR